MRRLCRALVLYIRTEYTWRASWCVAKDGLHFRTVAKDGFLYVEPRA